jgi:hypothetical protein
LTLTILPRHQAARRLAVRPAQSTASSTTSILKSIRYHCTTADLPGGAAAGDAITVDGTAYTVRVIQPEGPSVTTLVLEKI